MTAAVCSLAFVGLALSPLAAAWLAARPAPTDTEDRVWNAEGWK